MKFRSDIEDDALMNDNTDIALPNLTNVLTETDDAHFMKDIRLIFPATRALVATLKHDPTRASCLRLIAEAAWT
jgi:hypothetical protein